MSGTRNLKIVAAMFAALLFLPSCSGDGTGVEPGPTRVSMTGGLTFPADTLVDLDDVTIGLGSDQVAADTNGAFSIGGNKSAPSMVIAFDQDTIPMLIGIVADPQEGTHIEMNLHSTALALAFLSPFVCVSDPSAAEDVISLLEGLPELEELEDVLGTRLAADPLALSVEDAVTDSALSGVVQAYMDTYPSTVLLHYPNSVDPRDVKGSAASAVLYIDPSYEKSGHRITYVSSGKFKVTNSLGRWAYCVTPTDSFYVFPNGTLMDAIRLDPFRTSEREFNLEVIANEPPQEVNLYGFGMAPDADNIWDNLGPREQIRAQYGGWSTFFFEFVPHVVSVISGVNKTVGNKEIAEHYVFKTMQLLSTDARLVERTMMYLQEGNMWGMATFYTKWGLKKILSKDAFGEALLGATGIQLGPEALVLVAAQLNVAARVIVTSDAVASVIKTFIGYRNSRYKTVFEIWSESVGFGNISGSVHDDDDATPVSGVRVVVLGDEGNPMDPSHEDITSEAGAFYFGNIMAGEKTLEISKAGYEAKAVGVTVKSGKTVTVAVTLGKEVGTVQGKVINEILRRNEIDPNTFRGDCSLDVQEIGGTGQTFAYVISDGQYAKDLAPGNWRLIAYHDLYWPDTVEVTVEEEAIAQAPDIILYPRGRMEGEISLDMDGNGTWEKQFTFTSFMTAAATLDYAAGRSGGQALGSFLEVLGVTGGFGTATYEFINMQIDLGQVTGPGYFNLGGYPEVLIPSYGVPAGLYYLTNKEKCYHPDAGYQDMIFLVHSDPEVAPCNCGITSFGSLVLERFGTELTDIVSGGIVADLAGYTNCSCYCCEDVDGDGEEDDWVVDCAKARLSIDFAVVVGSLMSGQMSDEMRSAGELRAREMTGSTDR